MVGSRLATGAAGAVVGESIGLVSIVLVVLQTHPPLAADMSASQTI